MILPRSAFCQCELGWLATFALHAVGPVLQGLLLLLCSCDAPFVCGGESYPAQEVSRSSLPKAAPKRFVVIAPRQFHAALGEFIQYKSGLLPTELVALETVLAESSGVDDPEKLKRYFYEGWRHRNLGYALLVGDVDVMPVRFMVLDRVTPAAFDYAFYPSDFYYSDLAKADGSMDDWNACKDGFHAGYFGEVRGEKNKQDPINFDAVDYHPDLSVGRWPVSTPEEARLVALKTIAYEKNLLAGNLPIIRRAAFFNVAGWVDSRRLMDRWAQELAPGWHIEKRYYGDGRRAGTPQPPTAEELMGLLNAGVNLVVHSGHGEADGWVGCLSLNHLDRIHNGDRLPIVISAGCSTAYFAPLPPYQAYTDVNGVEHKGTDHGEVFSAPPPAPAPYQKGRFNPAGLGEQLLKASTNGAVAYIGCNTGSQPCGLTLVEGFLNAVAHSDQPKLGDCWAQAVSFYFDKERLASLKPNNDWYPPSIFFQGMKFMLFGDPTLRLPGKE